MKLFHWILASLLTIVLSGTCCSAAEPAKAENDFLQVRGAQLYLHGKPFNEISFNKFDLFWQMQVAEFGRGGFGKDPAASAEQALKDLNSFGFKTIRVFCYSPNCSDYFDPARRPRFLAAMDRTLDLCDKYDIRVIASLSDFEDYYVRTCGEPYTDLINREDSKSRQMARQFVRELVLRYRDRKTIAMWEHGNELLLKADIGGRTRTWGKMKIPTLDEIARFHAQEAAFIRSLDPNHPVTTGDSYRNCIWSLYQFAKGLRNDGWTVNIMADIGQAVGMAQKGVDVFCIHSYFHSMMYGCHPVMGADGKLTALNLADWTKTAHAQGQPLYIGEYSAMPMARTKGNAKFWAENPQWFESYEGPDREKAEKMVQTALDQLVAAKPNLTHWWCYQSNRDLEQDNPQRFDVDMTRTPKLIRLIAQANRKLQMETMGFTYMKDPAECRGGTPTSGSASPRPRG